MTDDRSPCGGASKIRRTHARLPATCRISSHFPYERDELVAATPQLSASSGLPSAEGSISAMIPRSHRQLAGWAGLDARQLRRAGRPAEIWPEGILASVSGRCISHSQRVDSVQERAK